MNSNEKVIGMKVVRLIETRNFAFWIISIQGHMQILEPKYCRHCLSSSAGGSPHHRVCGRATGATRKPQNVAERFRLKIRYLDGLK
jgi:hypothetical protein